MPRLNDDDRQEIQQLFTERLTEPVTVYFYTQGASPLAVPSLQCQTCREEPGDQGAARQPPQAGAPGGAGYPHMGTNRVDR